MSRVKLLVEAGANVNYKNEYGSTPLKVALTVDNYDVVLYLLQKGASYNEPMMNSNGKDLFILDMLRKDVFPLDSKKYEQKMGVVAFLKNEGLDYKKAPIPDYIKDKIKKDYPNDWREYLKKY